MQIPDPSTAGAKLLPLGEYLLAGLSETPEKTGSLIEVFRPTHDNLVVKNAALVTAERAMIGPRVALRFSERRLELVIRQLFRGAQGLDGKAGGPIAKALFPQGSIAETKPRSDAQKAKTEALLVRLQTVTLAEPLRAQFVPLLQSGIADLTARLAARKAAGDALGVAYAEELAAREDFVRAYDATAGAIRQIFPRDRPTQDLYFDTFRGHSRPPTPTDDDADTDPDGGDGGENP